MGSLNIFSNTQKYCPLAKVIYLSTNKVYSDGPNSLKLVEKKTRYEPISKLFLNKGINENFNIDNSILIFFVSKTYAISLLKNLGKIMV